MGCGASTGDKYKGEAVASTADAKGASAEPAKPAAKAEPAKTAAATEPPPEKPPQQEQAPAAQGEAQAAPAAAAEGRAEAAAAEPPAGARPEAAEALATTGAQPGEAPAPSEPAPSLAADAVVAEAEAVLAESATGVQVQAEPTIVHHYEDPEFPSFRSSMGTSSALLVLDRSSGAGLGISVRGAESVLLITMVAEEGLVPAWNRANPERAVGPGNIIIQVNGLCGGAEQLLEEIQKEESLRVEVDRTDREVRASISSNGMAHWCREQIQTIYERHDEAGLKTLDRRMNTYKDRELALYRTLSKKFGEEPKDPEMCANSVEDIEL